MSKTTHTRSSQDARRRNSESGFSLPEVLIAVVIFSVGMLGVGSMLMASINNDEFNKKKRYAEDVAMDIAERFKAGNPDEWPNEGTRRFIYHPHDPADEETGLEDISAIIYDWKVYKCRGCDDGLPECVAMTDSFVCGSAPSQSELPTRLIDIWVGWGSELASSDSDPMEVCESLTTPTAKCRKKRVHLTTWYQKF